MSSARSGSTLRRTPSARVSTWRCGWPRAAFSRDLAAPHQLRHQRVVVGQLADLAAAHQVGAAVADVGQRDALLAREQRDQRGAHAGELGLGLGGRQDLAVRGGAARSAACRSGWRRRLPGSAPRAPRPRPPARSRPVPRCGRPCRPRPGRDPSSGTSAKVSSFARRRKPTSVRAAPRRLIDDLGLRGSGHSRTLEPAPTGFASEARGAPLDRHPRLPAGWKSAKTIQSRGIRGR